MMGMYMKTCKQRVVLFCSLSIFYRIKNIFAKSKKSEPFFRQFLASEKWKSKRALMYSGERTERKGFCMAGSHLNIKYVGFGPIVFVECVVVDCVDCGSMDFRFLYRLCFRVVFLFLNIFFIVSWSIPCFLKSSNISITGRPLSNILRLSDLLHTNIAFINDLVLGSCVCPYKMVSSESTSSLRNLIIVFAPELPSPPVFVICHFLWLQWEINA